MEKMKANVFYGKDDIRVEKVERPSAVSEGQGTHARKMKSHDYDPEAWIRIPNS